MTSGGHSRIIPPLFVLLKLHNKRIHVHIAIKYFIITVADMLKAEIIKDKKAEKLIAEMKSASSIDQVKSMANAVSDSVKHITFSAPAYVSVTRASEPALGAYASKAEINKLTGPIKGNAGVYMIQVYNKEKSAEEFDAKNEENNLSNMAGRYASSFINDLYKKADVKDDRYLYF